MFSKITIILCLAVLCKFSKANEKLLSEIVDSKPETSTDSIDLPSERATQLLIPETEQEETVDLPEKESGVTIIGSRPTRPTTITTTEAITEATKVPSIVARTTGAPATGESITEEPITGEPASGESATGESATGEIATGVLTSRGSSTGSSSIVAPATEAFTEAPITGAPTTGPPIGGGTRTAIITAISKTTTTSAPAAAARPPPTTTTATRVAAAAPTTSTTVARETTTETTRTTGTTGTTATTATLATAATPTSPITTIAARATSKPTKPTKAQKTGATPKPKGGTKRRPAAFEYSKGEKDLSKKRISEVIIELSTVEATHELTAEPTDQTTAEPLVQTTVEPIAQTIESAITITPEPVSEIETISQLTTKQQITNKPKVASNKIQSSNYYGVWWYAENNVTCIIVQFMLTITFSYITTDNEKANYTYSVPNNQRVTVADGSCGNETQYINLQWDINGTKNDINITFAKISNVFAVDTFRIKFHAAAQIPNAIDDQIMNWELEKKDLLAPIGKSYKCQSEINVVLRRMNTKKNDFARMSGVKFEACRKEHHQTFSKPVICTFDSNGNVKTAIISMVVIFIIIVIILLVYTIYTQRKTEFEF